MKAVEFVYTCKAEDDLDSIFDYIAENSAENALNYIDRVQSAIENLLTSPKICSHLRIWVSVADPKE